MSLRNTATRCKPSSPIFRTGGLCIGRRLWGNNVNLIMRSYALFLIVFLIASCKQSSKLLPILGNPTISGKDTVYPTIADFSLTDQDGQTVTNKSFQGKIYVADFIFLSCPTICPKMTKEMYNAYLPFSRDTRVAFISHTIDPEHDTLPRLKAYAAKLGV